MCQAQREGTVSDTAVVRASHTCRNNQKVKCSDIKVGVKQGTTTYHLPCNNVKTPPAVDELHTCCKLLKWKTGREAANLLTVHFWGWGIFSFMHVFKNSITEHNNTQQLRRTWRYESPHISRVFQPWASYGWVHANGWHCAGMIVKNRPVGHIPQMALLEGTPAWHRSWTGMAPSTVVFESLWPLYNFLYFCINMT